MLLLDAILSTLVHALFFTPPIGWSLARTKGTELAGGTNIGDHTSAGGLAAAFDGVTSQSDAAAATQATKVNDSFVGKTLAARIWSVDCYGSNNKGYADVATSITLYLMAKTGAAPSSSTDGTELGSISFTGLADESSAREILSSDVETVWDHFWLRINHSGAVQKHFAAETDFFESV